jgi:hypothetical protein
MQARTRFRDRPYPHTRTYTITLTCYHAIPPTCKHATMQPCNHATMQPCSKPMGACRHANVHTCIPAYMPCETMQVGYMQTCITCYHANASTRYHANTLACENRHMRNRKRKHTSARRTRLAERICACMSTTAHARAYPHGGVCLCVVMHASARMLAFRNIGIPRMNMRMRMLMCRCRCVCVCADAYAYVQMRMNMCMVVCGHE